MADRFVADILSDDSPVVATSRYTDQLFGPSSAFQQQQQHTTGYQGVNSGAGGEASSLTRGALAAKNALDGSGDDADNTAAPAGLFAPTSDADTDASARGGAGAAGGATDIKSAAPVLAESEDAMRAAIANEIQWMLRFALLFINFTFIVAALLMTLAGAIAVNTPSLTICSKCQRLAVAPVVLGLALWFSGLFAFYWIKQRTVLFLLLHAGAVVFVAVGVFICAIIALAFNGTINHLTDDDLLQAWSRKVSNTTPSVESPLCQLQLLHNCSGVKFGCCVPGACYDAAKPPAWVAEICANCFQSAAKGVATPASMCSWDVLQRTSKTDMAGFVIVLWFAFVLLATGMGLAMFVRRINAAGTSSGFGNAAAAGGSQTARRG